MFTNRIMAALFFAVLPLVLQGCAHRAPAFPVGNAFRPDTVYRIDANAEKSFHSAYFLLVPASAHAQAKVDPITIGVEPNNTGTSDNSIDRHEESALERVERNRKAADILQSVLLVPAFPRPKDHSLIYTHALDRDTLTTRIPALSRPDLQLIAMIEDARGKLSGAGLQTQDKVIMVGFSAAGTFVNRFTMLHPKYVRVALIGAPGGWPMVPVSEHMGERLPYPVGTADIETLTGQPFDQEAFCAVPKFFYLGDQDDNDSVHYKDSFDKPHADLVDRLFGNTPVKRWDDARDLFGGEGCAATFKLYAGVGHKTTPEMLADQIEFTRAALKNPQ